MASLNSVLHRLAGYLHPDDPVHKDIDEVAPVEEKGEEDSENAAE
jgi:hypothetical protein